MQTGETRGFRSREAAMDYQCARSLTPAYCCIYTRDPQPIVTDPITRARGRVYTWSYRAKSRDGQYRQYFGSYVGS